MLSVRLNKLLASLPSDTLPDLIAARVPAIGITKDSYLRYGDKNRLTRGIKKFWVQPDGLPLDILTREVDPYSQYDEQRVIEEIVDFIEKYDTAAKLEQYARKRIKESATVKQKQAKQTAKDVEKFVQLGLRTLSAKTLRDELKTLQKSPAFYFGPLLDVPDVETNLFNLPDEKQQKFAKSALWLLGTAKYKDKKGRSKDTVLRIDSEYKAARLAKVAEFRAGQAEKIIELARDLQKHLRDPKAAKRDAKTRSKKTYPATEAGLLAWARNPGGGDMDGVDTPY